MAESPIPLICILGPTAAGKTRLAAHVAAAANGEVVSADSRQVYRYMDIGTGKDLEDYRVDGLTVRSHLIDIVDPGYEYNLYEFKRDCIAAIREIHSRGRLPVLCGGTGLYLSAVLQDYQLLPAPPDPTRRAELQTAPTEQLIAELRSHGPLHNTSDVPPARRRSHSTRAPSGFAGSAASCESASRDDWRTGSTTGCSMKSALCWIAG
jgi:tRNA dimethylallyltransferase